ncbi:MAG TPA: alpha/beta fold hydrolase [Acetobacteraceae bacterium]|nr:alpha/beta fold hydrolase [Acetobacteraceae bacterium]
MPTAILRPLVALLAMALLLSGCAAPVAPGTFSPDKPPVTAGYFDMPDGTLLPYRAWLPDGPPRAVVLALHGMNDSRDAWEYPAPAFTDAGIALFAPDQRGFGAAPDRGWWAGDRQMVSDARHMADILHRRYPHTRLILMGESMGAAVLMVLAAQPDPPPVSGYVMISPAVWDRNEMNWFLRAGLWLFSHAVPGMTVTGRGFVHVAASDNKEAIRKLSDDPLTILATRWIAVRGLVNLMGAAVAAAPHLHGRVLFLYGGHDELIPKAANAAIWRILPSDVEKAYYPAGYHLMLRDHERITPTEDVLSWIVRPNDPLPSGADRAAEAWLAKQPADQDH